MSILADDDVVVHDDAERIGDIDDRFCHLNVRLRQRRIAGGMVVQQTTVRLTTLISFVFRPRRLGAVIGDGS